MRVLLMRVAISPEQRWPSYDERLLVEDEVEIVLQINGKVRDRMKMSILRNRRRNENRRALESEDSRAYCWQDCAQGGRRPEKACQYRRRLVG